MSKNKLSKLCPKSNCVQIVESSCKIHLYKLVQTIFLIDKPIFVFM